MSRYADAYSKSIVAKIITKIASSFIKKGLINMLQALKNATNYKHTANGGVTHKTSNSALVDYFAQGSALRNRPENEIIKLFDKAYAENPLLALKILFYSRDIRGGQGERDTFRTLIKHIAENYPKDMLLNIEFIPEFGRWDDIYALFDTQLEKNATNLISKQLFEDANKEHPSLIAKWLKSENTSSKESRRLALKTMKNIGLTPKQYRKMLSTLRSRIDIVESHLSSKEYNKIDYSKLPSNAGLKYRSAFYRNDEERYLKYIEDLKSGKTTAKAKTLYPYEIVRLVTDSRKNDDLANELWKALPDYIGDNNENCIAVVDVSGSMYGTPMQVAISLGLYLAERNKGAFANHFITFSNNPDLVEVKGNTFAEKVRNMERADWGMNTNIEATFDLILNAAIKENIPQEELPSRIMIISDMEFDECQNNRWGNSNKKANFDIIKEKFENAGYRMPSLVFWNVNSVQDNIPMTMNEEGVQLVSGANPVLFETLLKGEFLSAYDIMMSAINTERYACIKTACE